MQHRSERTIAITNISAKMDAIRTTFTLAVFSASIQIMNHYATITTAFGFLKWYHVAHLWQGRLSFQMCGDVIPYIVKNYTRRLSNDLTSVVDWQGVQVSLCYDSEMVSLSNVASNKFDASLALRTWLTCS